MPSQLPGRLTTAFIAAACVALASPISNATVLVFRPDIGLEPVADSALDNSGVNYGDRVAGDSQDGFEYGDGGGFTPNVVVDYGTNPTGSTFFGFVSGYGNLDYGIAADAATNDLIAELTLTADAGFHVRLESFNLAAQGQDRVADVTVLNELNAVLFSQAAAPIDGTGGRTAFEFDPLLEGNALKIRLQPVGAGAADETIGIDSIEFSQLAVPEPSAAVLAALVAAALTSAGRRLRR